VLLKQGVIKVYPKMRRQQNDKRNDRPGVSFTERIGLPDTRGYSDKFEQQLLFGLTFLQL